MASGRPQIRVLICDDHAVFRKGLAMVLADDDGISVVGEAADGEEAATRAAELAPDVVLMDVRMPGRGGIEATRTVRSALPTAKILMLTVSDEEADLYEAIKAGANGYLMKEVSLEEVADAVRAVVDGQSLIPPHMASQLLAEFSSLARQAEQVPNGPASRSGLTDRELEVLRLLGTGLSNADIGERLFISANTVKNHVRRVLDKLHVSSRVGAALYAQREHLLEADD